MNTGMWTEVTAAHPGQVTMQGKVVLKQAGNAKTNKNTV